MISDLKLALRQLAKTPGFSIVALLSVGISIGLALAFGLSRLLSGFLYGMGPFDSVIFAGVPLLLLLIAVSACLLPAWRATRVNPMEALCAE